MNTPNLKLIQDGAEASAEAEKITSSREELENALRILGAERKDGKLILSFSRETMLKGLKKEDVEVDDDISEKELSEKFLDLVVNPWLKILVGEGSTAGLLETAPKKAASDVAAAA